MHRVFNCGIGLVVAIGAAHAERAIARLRDHGETARVIGEVVAQPAGEPPTVVV